MEEDFNFNYISSTNFDAYIINFVNIMVDIKYSITNPFIMGITVITTVNY